MSRFLNCACVAVLSAILIPAFGEEASDLPKVKILGCEEACAKWTDPKPIGKHSGWVPHSEWERGGDMGDSFVAIRLTVTADGHVKDPVLLKLIGPPTFGRSSLEAVKAWRYEPATADGVPAERPNWYAELTYSFSDARQGARPEVYTACKKAQELLSESKFSDAQALLLPILTRPRLHFYERAMISLLLSVSYGLQKDYATARDYAEDATLQDGRYLDSEAQEAAIRQRIRLEAATGQYGNALDWYEKLKKLKQPAADDPEAKLIEHVKTLLASPEPIRVVGRISNTGTLFLWNHTLLRRSFAFPVIEGKLDQLQLDCDQKNSVSPITTKAQWNVPKSWSDCHLLVSGEPGTKFLLVEGNE